MDLPFEPPSEMEKRQRRERLYLVAQTHFIEAMKAEIRRAVGVLPRNSDRVPRELAISKTKQASQSQGVSVLTVF